MQLPQRNLRRLAPEYYQRFSWVHWTMALDHRRQGWLSTGFHNDFRLLLLHMCARNQVICPAYCLMPDHMHLLLMGVSESSDQQLAIRFLRKHINFRLRTAGDFELQRQAFEHVLNTHERDAASFENAAIYIRENPVRKRLATAWADWPFSGCMVPGYPELNPASEGFWESFWRIHHALVA